MKTPWILTAAVLAGTLMFQLQPLQGGDADEVSISSPNGKIRIRVILQDRLAYAVDFEGEPLIMPSFISLTVGEERVLGASPKLENAKTRSVRDVIRPPVREKRAEIPDIFNELSLDFLGDWGLRVRAYDDGAAYRFTTRLPGEIKVVAEEVSFVFPSDHAIWIPFAPGFHSSFEAPYTRLPLSEIGSDRFGFAPVLVDAGRVKVAVTEADLEDYPGMFLKGNDERKPELSGLFAPYPLEEKMREKSNRRLEVVRAADYLAFTQGSRDFPWRVLAISSRDADLVENDIVYRLGPPLEIADTSWIRPGKVAWDWWNALNLFGVDFRAGVNTATYMHYVDFAAKSGLEYVILDEGWSDPADLFKINPDIDMERILAHAREKNVGVILWCVWVTLDRQMEQALDLFASWGVKGIKVDFMDRDDQTVVRFYRRCATAAASRRLLVNFHGAYKPTGLRRAFPNVLTREGVLGLEHSKWSANVTPGHDLMIPFIRMLAGPMDYTPGAVINASEKQFRPVFDLPMSQGTRAHQLAMYVIYESPLQMLCDSPSLYDREPDAMAFLSSVPTVWDETRALDGRVGAYIAAARRSGEEWYIGAMTDWEARTIALELDFLGEGEYRIEIWADGPNADRHPSDIRRETRKVRRGDSLSVVMAPGGGWAARLVPIPD